MQLKPPASHQSKHAALVSDGDAALLPNQRFAESLHKLASEIRSALHTHQSAISFIPLGDFQAAIHTHSFSEKFEAFNTYDVMPTGQGIWSLVVREKFAVRMTEEELHSHPMWKQFSDIRDARGQARPPMRGWLAAPVLNAKGDVLGLLQLSDKENFGDFTEADLDHLIHMAQLVAPTFELQHLNQQLEQRARELSVNQQQLVESLQGMQTKLDLAQQAAEIGTFDWDLGSDAARCGRESDGRAVLESFPSLQLWISRLHPEDRPRCIEEVRRAFEERVPYLTRYRVIWPDGSVHWVTSRAQLTFDETGRPSHMIGAQIDITSRVQAEDTVRQIVDGIAPRTGHEFFDTLASRLGQACQVDFAALTRLASPNSSTGHTMAVWHCGKLVPNFSYGLHGTPCENVIQGDLCYYASGIQELFPKDVMLKAFGFDSYLGIPLFGSAGQTLGLIVLMHSQPFSQPDQANSLLRVVAARAGAELQRVRTETLLVRQSDVLRLIATAQPLPKILAEIVALVEERIPGSICSVLLREGDRLRHGAGKNLPDAYNQAIDGIQIGPAVGSCGTAAWSGQTVIVRDIATDPLWANFKDLALGFGLRSCWSFPILASDSDGVIKAPPRVLGTFVVYYREPTDLDEESLQFMRDVAHLVGIAIERVQTTQSLQLFRKLIDHASDTIEVIDPETGRYLDVNQAGCQTHGFTKEEYLARGISDLDPEMNKSWDYQQMLVQVRQHGRLPALRTVHLRKDGSAFPVEVSASIIQLDREYLVAVVRDITERIREEEKQRLFELQMQQTQKLESLGVLAGGIAHDFNNLLTSILGYADLALLDVPSSSQARRYLGEVINGSRQAAELVRQMLAYAGQGLVTVEPTNLSALVEDMVRLLQISISKKCVVKYDLAADLPAVDADSSQLRQIVMNLVINASEAIGERSGLVVVSTGRMFCGRDYLADSQLGEPLPAGEYVYFEVADSGCGMSDETKRRIFDPFFTTKFTGRGLGLSAVLGIAKSHRGTIRCYSELDVGTTFKVLLPVSSAEIQPSPMTPTHTKLWQGTGTILLIDDEESVRESTCCLLELMGLTVLKAADGREGLKIFQTHPDPIDLVILDMTMPHLNGEETFRELRQVRANVRAILMSGYSEITATSRFVGKGLLGFLQKPFRIDELTDSVRNALGDKPSS